ncbi:MAG TPA: hypothetical protein VE263_13105, partial [Candidatus Angelobacter sp.]|nr:hypothetical protein [Candidatus Angelobacter sp.]
PAKTPASQKETNNPQNQKPQSTEVATGGQSIGRTDKEGPAHPSQNGEQYDPRKDSLYRWYMRGTIFGAVGTVIGIGVLIYQSIQIRKSTDASLRSTKATERSVKLQEDTQRQWVDLSDWQVFRINPTDPLEIQFNVANGTNLPLMLHGIDMTVDGKRINEDSPIMLVTPKDPIPHGIGIPLSTDQEALFERNAC